MNPRRFLLLPTLLTLAACDRALEPSGPTLVRTCPSEVYEYVAYRDGNADWVRVLPDVDSSFALAPQNKAVIVTVDSIKGAAPNPDIILVGYKFVAASEVSSVLRDGCAKAPILKTLTGTALDVPTNTIARVYAGPGISLVDANGAYRLTGVPDGPVDLVAAAVSSSSCPLNGSPLRRVVVRRGLDFDGSYPIFSFAADGSEPEQHPLAIDGLGAGTTWTGATQFRTNTTTAQLGRFCGATASSVSYQMVPAALRREGDQHEFFAFTNGLASRFLYVSFANGADLTTVGFGPPLASLTRTELPGPPLRYRVELERQTEYGAAVFVSLSQNGGGQEPTRFVSISVTRGYAGDVSTWALEIPEPPQGAGWDAAWNLSAAPLSCTVTATSADITTTNSPLNVVFRRASAVC